MTGTLRFRRSRSNHAQANSVDFAQLQQIYSRLPMPGRQGYASSALTTGGVSAEVETEKSRSKVAKTTVSAEPAVTVQVAVPEQPATPQLVKAEPVAAAAVSVTAVP